MAKLDQSPKSNDNINEQNEFQKIINRKEFLMRSVLLFPGLLVGDSFLKAFTVGPDENKKPLTNEEIKQEVIYLRALTTEIPNQFLTPSEFYQARNNTFSYMNSMKAQGKTIDHKVVDGIAQGNPWDVSNSINTFIAVNQITKEGMKDLAEGAGYAGAVATLLSFPAALPLAIGGLGAYSLSYAFPDSQTEKLVSDLYLNIETRVWGSPKAMNTVEEATKKTMVDLYGMDPFGSLEDLIKKMPEKVASMVEVYIDNAANGIVQNQQEMADEIVDKLSGSINQSTTAIISYMENEKSDERKRQRENSDIQGAIYMANLLASFVSPEAGKVINTLTSSGLQISNILTGIAGGTMGPIGAVAGFSNIAMSFAGLFGSSKPTADQMIMKALGGIQESLNELRKDMSILFGKVFENQQKMMEQMDKQFELLRTEGRNQHKEVIKNLEKINSLIEISLDEGRKGRREIKNEAFEKKLEMLELEVGIKLNSSGTPKINVLIDAIIDFHAHGINESADFSFTGLPNSGEEKIDMNDYKTIITKFETIDSVDHYLGYVLAIIERYTGEVINKRINNPRELGRAISAMSIAYSVFPEAVKQGGFENPPYNNYIKDFKNAIIDTQDILAKAISKETIDIIKTRYLNIISSFVDNIVDDAYSVTINNFKTKNKIEGNDDIKIFAYGPLNEISLDQKNLGNRTGNIVRIDDHSVLIAAGDPNHTIIFNIDSRFDANSYPNWGNFFIPIILGIDPENAKLETNKPSDLFEFAQKFEVLRPSGNVDIVLSRPFSYIQTTDDGNKTFSFREDLKIKQFYYWEPGKEKTMPMGEYFAWADVRLNDLSTGNVSDIETSVYSDSYNFLDKLREGVNKLYELRANMIKNTEDKFSKFDEDSEFRVLTHSLRYLAGVNTYIRSGDLHLATHIARKDLKALEKHIIKEKKESDPNSPILGKNEFVEKEVQFISPPFSVKYVTDLVKYVTATYMQNVKKEKAGNPDIKEYLKTQLIEVIKTAMDDYIETHFSEKFTEFNLPELSIPVAMLASVEQSF